MPMRRRSSHDAGTGTVVTPFMEVLPVQIPIIVYSATRLGKPACARGQGVLRSDRGSDRSHYGRCQVARAVEANYIKLPPEILRTCRFPASTRTITDESLQNWVAIMATSRTCWVKIDVSKRSYADTRPPQHTSRYRFRVNRFRGAC